MKPLQKLSKMVDKEFIYRQENIIIKSIDFNNIDGLIIETNGKPIKLHANEIGKFIEACLPIEQKGALTILNEKDNSQLNDLSSMLFENIKNIQVNPAYINQANAINKQVNTIINLAKLKIDVLKSTQ